MGTRKKNLSRSRDHLDEMDEDVWHDKTKMLKDHIAEVYSKWSQIDGEIWSKLIIFERNRRVAKAYARAPIVGITGTDYGFDGFTIGLSGFDNPHRDQKTENYFQKIDQGVYIKKSKDGSISLLKDATKANVYIRERVYRDVAPVQVTSSELHPLSDIYRIRKSIKKQLNQAYPDRQKLQFQCISAFSFSDTDTGNLFDSPSWILVINIEALKMLREHVPMPVEGKRLMDPSPGRPATARDEEMYSELPAKVKQGKQPPKLPPRDCPRAPQPSRALQPQQQQRSSPREYSEQQLQSFYPLVKSTSKKHIPNGPEDPYYRGLKARVPEYSSSQQQFSPRTAYFSSKVPSPTSHWVSASSSSMKGGPFDTYVPGANSSDDSGVYSIRPEMVYVGEWE